MYGLNAADESRLMNTGDVDAHIQVANSVKFKRDICLQQIAAGLEIV
ncbi:hypothetical protein EV14_0016 [Prochlorococcus sp. MIT 0703]|nr:hypothetical protein EV12_0924 [Prochlorococcus sp. MIT 0701]KGG37224.1 hypothetical protein EV14_0016 [Prochlorococcus sp. MIT 0703]